MTGSLADCRQEALRIWAITQAHDKAQAMQALWQTLSVHADAEWQADGLSAVWQQSVDNDTPPPLVVGRPDKPTLVPATAVPPRSPFTPEGRAALLHAICHIEFNAINLALDAVWRFPGMPALYYRDWLKVAGEEALHFALLAEHLQSLGYRYGDFDAHDGLWAMCERTSHDILARMALVPRTLEARGLDATPPIQAKLAKAGDARAVAILDIILRDEIGHVAIGNHWYHHLCGQRGLNPVETYPALVKQYEAPRLRPPYNMQARLAAGFTQEEMQYLCDPDHPLG